MEISTKYSLKLQALAREDVTVAMMMKAGADVEDIVDTLVGDKNRFCDRIMYLESICPRRIRLSDGSVRIWHCPDALIGEYNDYPG